jgi:mono/diheme cytochrome c family protein
VRRAAAALAVLVLAGCGTGGMADEETAANGQELFTQKCGGCHALEAANTQGTIGPDLDAAFAVPREEGFDETSIREVVLGQMRFPIPPMPKPTDPAMFPESDFSDAEREDAMEAIALFVAEVAANPQAAAAAGGGNADESDPVALFTTNCASCHTFAPAQATGTIGPNLDQSRLEVGAIAEQIRRGGGGMPAFEGKLTDAQIEALAKLIAER